MLTPLSERYHKMRSVYDAPAGLFEIAKKRRITFRSVRQTSAKRTLRKIPKQLNRFAGHDVRARREIINGALVQSR